MKEVDAKLPVSSGVERPSAYTTVAPSKPAAAQFIPRAGLGDSAEEIQMDGRQNIPGLRWSYNPDSIARAQNGVGGNGERNSRIV